MFPSVPLTSEPMSAELAIMTVLLSLAAVTPEFGADSDAAADAKAFLAGGSEAAEARSALTALAADSVVAQDRGVDEVRATLEEDVDASARSSAAITARAARNGDGDSTKAAGSALALCWRRENRCRASRDWSGLRRIREG